MERLGGFCMHNIFPSKTVNDDILGFFAEIKTSCIMSVPKLAHAKCDFAAVFEIAGPLTCIGVCQ